MSNLNNNGAAVRNSFINEFAFGDKTKAIQDLLARSASLHRFDGITSDEFIYQALASETQVRARRHHTTYTQAIAIA